MRILALQFRNLNSLQGDQQIRFDQPPLAHAGLFAITGPTGAGKTTILDAITLALYGRAARYDRATPSEVMSRHTGDCFAEMQFESRGRSYGARWELRRARGKAEGALQSPKRMIYDLVNKETIVDKVREVDEWVARHTGLDYERFLRSVLLAQGDFTAFLKASDKERGQLLEKLTGMEIYAELSQLAHEVTREKQQTVDESKLRIDGIQLLQPEEMEEKQAILSQSRKTLERLSSHVQEQRELFACLEGWQALAEKRRLHALAEEALKKESDGAADWRAKLTQHRQVEPFADTIITWRDLRKRQEEAISELKALWESSQRLMKEAAAKAQASKRAGEEHEKNKQAFTQLSQLIEQVAPLDHERRLRNEQVTESQRRLTEQANALKPLDGSRKKREMRLDALDKRILELETWLAEHLDDARLSDTLPLWQRQFDKVQQLEDQLDKLNERQSKHQQRLQDLQPSLKDLGQKRAKLESAIEKDQAHLQTLAQEEIALLEGRSITEWEKAQRTLRDDRMLFETLLSKSLSYQQIQERQATLKQRLTAHRKELKQLIRDMAKGEKAQAEAEQACALRRQLVQRGREIQSLRAALKDDQPCTVCGATDHPWQSHRDSVAEEQELQEYEATLGRLSGLQNQRRLQEARLHADISHRESEQTDAKKEMEVIEQEVIELQKGHEPVVVCTDLPGIQKRHAELERAQIREDLRLSNIRALHKRIEEARRERDRKKGEIQRIAQSMAKAEGQLQELTEQNDADRKQVKEITTEHAKLRDILASSLPNSNRALNSTKQIEQYLTVAQGRAMTHIKQAKEAESCEAERMQTKTALKSIRAQEAQIQKSIAEFQTQITTARDQIRSLSEKRGTLAGDRDLLGERTQLEQSLEHQQKSLKNLENQHQAAHDQFETTRALHAKAGKQEITLRAQREGLESKLSQACARLGLANLDALLTIYLPPAEAQASAAQDKALQDQGVRLQTEAAQLTRTEEELVEKSKRLLPQEQSLDKIDLPDWTAAFREQEEQVEIAKREVWNLEQLLKQDREKREQVASSLLALTKAEQDLARWQHVDQLIGSSDGSMFSRFAQSLTLKRLVDLANHHLRQLTDRYRIHTVPDKELEIEVVDCYQANSVRSMQSLSGGESFLVSLALALGLAELAGSRGKIESLFIDEGFGTLDADSLEVAIRALENLQAQNKTIGVISHTELLKERISCQIQVERGHGGTSSLQIVQR